MHITSGFRTYNRQNPLSVRSQQQLGASQYDLGSASEAAIIETIRQAGAISRTEISKKTGLTQQSVSRILRLLLERGLRLASFVAAQVVQQPGDHEGFPTAADVPDALLSGHP